MSFLTTKKLVSNLEGVSWNSKKRGSLCSKNCFKGWSQQADLFWEPQSGLLKSKLHLLLTKTWTPTGRRQPQVLACRLKNTVQESPLFFLLERWSEGWNKSPHPFPRECGGSFFRNWGDIHNKQKPRCFHPSTIFTIILEIPRTWRHFVTRCVFLLWMLHVFSSAWRGHFKGSICWVLGMKKQLARYFCDRKKIPSEDETESFVDS